MTQDEMVGWHHQLNRHESEQAPGDGEGQGSLAGCSPQGRKGSDMTEQLNNNIHSGTWPRCYSIKITDCRTLTYVILNELSK